MILKTGPPRHTHKWLPAAAVILTGTVFTVFHLYHAFNDIGHGFSGLLSGTIFPLVGSIPLIIGGYWVWDADWVQIAPRRFLQWHLAGIVGGLCGSIVYLLHGISHGSHPVDPFSVIAMSATYGGLVGFLLGRYDLQLKSSRAELERTVEQLDNFASVVSHDLRNPLNVSMVHLDLAQEDVESDHLHQVQEAHGRMREIIDDTLFLAKQGQTVDDVDKVALSTFVTGCWDHVKTGDATLSVTGDALLYADSDRLHHVFENLFRNAIEHGGDDLSVTVGSLNGDGFYVADDGPGIPISDRETVFEPGHTTSDDGTGFGLAIVKEIVEAHGWAIAVTESKEGGARFEITGVTME